MELTEHDRRTYAWQIDLPGIGEPGQERLKNARVLVSRVGGVGGLVAYELAAAGVGTLILAHGGILQPSDLNRQLLMRPEHLGRPRIDCVRETLLAFNPQLQLHTLGENVNPANVDALVGQCDLAVACVPLFEERLLLNRACQTHQKPLIDAAMHGMTGQLTTVLPARKTACVACRVPEPPPHWQRRFPVLGAVSGTVGCLAAAEAVKLITGVGELLANQLLLMDLASMQFRTLKLSRNPACAVCG